MNVEGGTLDVKTHDFVVILGKPTIRTEVPWRMSGVLNLRESNGFQARVAGSSILIGELAAGGTVAVVDVDGAPTIAAPMTVFEERSRLLFDIGGQSESLYDFLTLERQVNVGGSLEVALANAFAPSAGDSFDVVRAAGGVDGVFDSWTLPSLQPGLHWNIGYLDHAVRLTVATPEPNSFLLMVAALMMSVCVSRSRR
jgi:hypothetical protein